MNISKALKHLCAVKDVKQVDICNATGLSDAHVSQIFTGKIESPKISSMYLICKFLDISLDEFMKLANRYDK